MRYRRLLRYAPEYYAPPKTTPHKTDSKRISVLIVQGDTLKFVKFKIPYSSNFRVEFLSWAVKIVRTHLCKYTQRQSLAESADGVKGNNLSTLFPAFNFFRCWFTKRKYTYWNNHLRLRDNHFFFSLSLHLSIISKLVLMPSGYLQRAIYDIDYWSYFHCSLPIEFILWRVIIAIAWFSAAVHCDHFGRASRS